MSERFSTWREAFDYAQEQANKLGLDIKIRVSKEFGVIGWNVGIACASDTRNFGLIEPMKSKKGN